MGNASVAVWILIARFFDFPRPEKLRNSEICEDCQRDPNSLKRLSRMLTPCIATTCFNWTPITYLTFRWLSDSLLLLIMFMFINWTPRHFVDPSLPSSGCRNPYSTILIICTTWTKAMRYAIIWPANYWVALTNFHVALMFLDAEFGSEKNWKKAHPS